MKLRLSRKKVLDMTVAEFIAELRRANVEGVNRFPFKKVCEHEMSGDFYRYKGGPIGGPQGIGCPTFGSIPIRIIVSQYCLRAIDKPKFLGPKGRTFLIKAILAQGIKWARPPQKVIQNLPQ